MYKYFYKYFKYQNEDNKNDYFIYESSNIRNKIVSNIHNLHYNENNIQHYKLTGPSSNGKSTTLFYNCCRNWNRIYLNLNVLRQYDVENQKLKFIDVIITECSRLDLKVEDINILNQFIDKNVELDSFTFLHKYLETLSDISKTEKEK